MISSALIPPQIYMTRGYLLDSNGQIKQGLIPISAFHRQPMVIDIVDAAAVPPSENLDDRYILDTNTPVHANWDGAQNNDIVQFNGTTWDATTPLEGFIAYVDNKNLNAQYIDDGTPVWELVPTTIKVKGDLLGHDGSSPVRIPVGSNNQVLLADPSAPAGVSWQNALPNEEIDVFVVAIDGDTLFNLSATPSDPTKVKFYLQGQLRLYGTDFTVSGTVLTWLDPGARILLTTDTPIAIYNDTALSCGGIKSKKINLDYNGDNGSYHVRNISTNGSGNMSFVLPGDFGSLISLKIIGIPSAGASGPNKNIDFNSEYSSVDEASDAHSESDTTTLYDLTGKSGIKTEILDLISVFSNLSLGDSCGFHMDHNGIGGTIGYLYLDLVYNSN